MKGPKPVLIAILELVCDLQGPSPVKSNFIIYLLQKVLFFRKVLFFTFYYIIKNGTFYF